MTRRARLLACTAMASALFLGGGAAQAQTYWLGNGTDANWSTFGNFFSNPVVNADLVFQNQNRLENYRDAGVADYYQSITFSASAGAFVLGGLGITLTSGITNFALSTQTINFETLRLSGNQTFFAQAGNIVIDSPLIFALNPLANANQVLTVSGSRSVTINGPITEEGDPSSRPGELVKTGSGTLTLANPINTLRGGTSITGGGTIAITSASSLGTGGLTFGNGRLHVSGTDQTIALPVTLNAGGGTIDTDGVDVTLDGAISGTGGLVKDGSGELILTSFNTYEGGTTVRGGTLYAAQDNMLGDSAGGLTLDGGTLRMNTVSISRDITLAAGGGTFEVPVNLLVIGNMSGTGSLTKTGAGNLYMSGSSSYSGATLIQEGAIYAFEDSGLSASSTVAISSGASLAIAASVSSVIGGLSGAGSVALSVSSVLTVDVADGRTDTFSGVISGDGTFEKEDLGTLILTGTGSSVNALQVCCGVLDIQGGGMTVAGDTIVSGGTLKVTQGGTLSTDLLAIGYGMEISSGGHVTVGTYTQVGVLGGETLLVSDSVLESQGEAQILSIFSSTVATVTGSTSLWSIGTDLTIGIGQGGTNVLSVTNGARVTVGGAVSVDEYSRIELGDGGLAGSLTATSITNDGAIYADFSDTLTLAAPISGTGFLVKDGTGTLTLSGASTYTGSTSVEAGTLLVEGSLGTGDVNVQAGATLGGSGTMDGLVTVLNGGTLAPGSSPGTLTMGGLSLASGSILDYELGAPGTVGGGVNDLVIITGALELDGILNIRTLSGFASGTYRLMEYGSLTSDGGLMFGDVPAGYDLAVLTSAPGEVILVASYTGLQFWNGAQTSANGSVNGGAGTWDSTSTNWTSQSGNVATSWADLTAVFAGPSGGSVTVATDQTVAGLQFATDGYVLTGPGALLMASGGTEVRIDGGLGATIGVEIAGAGGLTKTGAGTITLTGLNTYSGGTSLNAGVLQVSADENLGAAPGGLVFNGGTLATTSTFGSARAVTINTVGRFDVAATTGLILSGDIAGAGTLVKEGTGILILTGTAAHAGGTLVSSGTLQVGMGGTTGALAGNVINNSEVAFVRSDTVTFAGDMTGTGSLRQSGTGTLILTGNVNLTGTTVINSGTLQVGDGGTTGTLTGAIDNNGFLLFNRSDSYTVANAISGFGIVGFSGGGTAVFSSTFNGGIAVADAGLVLDGNGLVGASVFVGQNGVLSGNGSVGFLQVTDGGVVAPGNSPGSISVAGDLRFDAGSVYRVDVTPDGAHDTLTAGGAVTLDAGAVVNVVAVPGRYRPEASYTILSTTDTITGQFGDVTSDYAFLSPSLSYDAQNVYLTLIYNAVPFATFANTPNQAATANGAQNLPFDNPIMTALIDLPVASVPGALDALSGEVYASTGTVIQQQAVYVRDAVGARLMQSLTAPGVSPLAYGAGPQTAALGEGLTPTLWAQGYGGWGNSFSNGNAATISNSIGGFLMGLDVALAPNVRAGLFGGFSQSQFDVADRSSIGSMNNVDLGLYAGAQFGAFALRGGASYTWHDVSTSRTVAFPGFAHAVEGGYSTGTTQVFGELGYDVAVGAYAFEPFVGLAYVNVAGASLQEGGGSAALSVSTSGMDTVYSTLGLRVATTMQVWGSTLTPHASVGWQHAFGDTMPTSTMQFLGGTTPFSVSGVPIAEDAVLLQAGLTYALSQKATLGASYTSQLASTAAQNAFTAQFSLKF